MKLMWLTDIFILTSWTKTGGWIFTTQNVYYHKKWAILIFTTCIRTTKVKQRCCINQVWFVLLTAVMENLQFKRWLDYESVQLIQKNNQFTGKHMKNIIFFALLLVLSACTYKHKSQITLPNTVKRISKAVTINIRGLAPLQVVARSSKIL